MLTENPIKRPQLELLSQYDFQGAQLLNSHPTPINLSESNTQLFNELFLSTWAVNRYHLSANETALLEFIAYQNPYTGGDAVYSARVLLGLDIADNHIASVERKGTYSNFIALDPGIIVPNPTTGKVQYIYDWKCEGAGILEIYTHRGNLIRSYSLLNEKGILDIDLQDQSSGMYLYSLILNGKRTAGNKIILQR